jgi:hypothetical protein
MQRVGFAPNSTTLNFQPSLTVAIT